MPQITWQDFEKVDIRVGEIVDVEEFPEARNPSYKLKVQFGEPIGIKKSCAQLTHYPIEKLLGTQVVAVVNFPPKQIATAVSEVLILGLPSEGGVSLLRPDRQVPLGGRVY